MIKMVNGGITIEVHEGDIDFYKRAGYSVVSDKPAPVAPEKVEPVAPAETDPKFVVPAKKK